jgi:hypothetical protein
MNYPTHAEWCQHLKEIGMLKVEHEPCRRKPPDCRVATERRLVALKGGN